MYPLYTKTSRLRECGLLCSTCLTLVAYRYGAGTVRNAALHEGRPAVLKLDIRHFFDSILYASVKEAALPAGNFTDFADHSLLLPGRARPAAPSNQQSGDADL